MIMMRGDDDYDDDDHNKGDKVVQYQPLQESFQLRLKGLKIREIMFSLRSV